MSNPVQITTHGKDMTVLRSKTFHFEPKLTTEPNEESAGTTSTAYPHCTLAKFYERWNKECDYKWSDSGLTSMTNVQAYNTTGQSQLDQGDNRTSVAPSERVYMLIKGEAFQLTLTQAYSQM